MQMLDDQENLYKELEILKNNKKKTNIDEKEMENLIVEDENAKIINTENKDNVLLKNKAKIDHKKELNNMVSKCDILLEVLDARDAFSYKSKELENKASLSKDKKLIILLNKTDLVSK
jgi:ribosome biogenesis GTPase A